MNRFIFNAILFLSFGASLGRVLRRRPIPPTPWTGVRSSPSRRKIFLTRRGPAAAGPAAGGGRRWSGRSLFMGRWTTLRFLPARECPPEGIFESRGHDQRVQSHADRFRVELRQVIRPKRGHFNVERGRKHAAGGRRAVDKTDQPAPASSPAPRKRQPMNPAQRRVRPRPEERAIFWQDLEHEKNRRNK